MTGLSAFREEATALPASLGLGHRVHSYAGPAVAGEATAELAGHDL